MQSMTINMIDYNESLYDTPMMEEDEFKDLSGKELIHVLHKDYSENLGRRDRQGGNAIKTVAEDIYADDAHFIKELIQNADDNQYPPDVLAGLKFNFLEDRLEVFCNEIGFNEKQVKAICSLGESTKKDRKKVNIGEKGIGFKSVFKVSSRPEIHSGNYHFYFDENTPHPEKPLVRHPYSLILPHWMDGHDPELGTKVILRYRNSEVKKEIEESVPKNMSGQILLFLRKVKKLSVEGVPNAQNFCHEKMCEEVAGITYTCVQSGSSLPERFMTVRRELDMSAIDEDRRKEHTQVSIDLAFPLETDGRPMFKEQKLYAYLPVDNFGLRFIVNSDFLLTGNRGDLHRVPWNQKIINEIGDCLKQAVLESQKNSGISGVFLNYLVDAKVNEISLLSEVVPSAKELLKAEDCIKTFSGKWRKPSEVFHKDEYGFLNAGIFSKDEIGNYLGNEFISSDFESVNVGILNDLGCKSLGIDELTKIFKDESFWQKRNEEFFKNLFHWLLVPKKDSLSALNSFIRVPVYPEKECKKPQDQNIYFPENGIESLDFVDQIVVLDNSFYSQLPLSGQNTTRLFLEGLGIRVPTFAKIVEDFIFPYHGLGNKNDLNNEGRLLRYLSKNYTALVSLENSNQELFSKLCLFQLHSKGVSNNQFVHTQIINSYFPGEAIEGSFENYLSADFSQLFIHQDYFKGISEDEKSGLLKLLKILGCQENPRVNSDGVLDDLLCNPEWNSRKWILKKLNANWSEYSECFILAPDSLLSCFVLCKDGEHRPLQNTYLDNEKTKLLGDDLPFLAEDLNFKEDFLKFTGVSCDLTHETLLKRLRDLQRAKSTDFGLILEIYRRLHSDWPIIPEGIKNAFKNEELVYYKKDKISGQWVEARICRYERKFNDSRINDSLDVKCIKNGDYEKIDGFFTENLQIQRNLSVDDLTKILEGIRDLPGDKMDQGSIYQIYRKLNDVIGNQSDLYSQVVRSKKIYYTSDEEFINFHDDVFAKDDEVLCEHFKSCEDIFFFFAAEEELPNLENFLHCAGIKRLSQAIEEDDPDYESKEPDDDWSTKVKKSWEYIARIYIHKYKKDYDRVIAKSDSKSFYNLSESVVSQVDNMKVRTGLRDNIREIPKDWFQSTDPVSFLLDKKTEETEKAFYLGCAICDYLLPKFTEPSELIEKILSSDYPEKILKSRKIAKLAKDERKKLMGEDWDDLQADDDEENDEASDLPGGVSGGDSGEGKNKPKTGHEAEDGGENGISTEMTCPGGGADDDSSGGASESGETETEKDGEKGENGERDGKTTGQGMGGSPKGKPKKPGIKKGKKGKSRGGPRNSQVGDFISYVKTSPTNDPKPSPDNPRTQRTIHEIDSKAVDFSLDDLKKSYGPKWEFEEMAHNNPGYDIYGQTKDGKNEVFIEVKGLKDAWNKGVQLSYKQFFFAKEKHDKYWLYIVERASEAPKLFKIKNPFLKTKKFIFDKGWKLVADGLPKSEDYEEKLKLDVCIGKTFRSRDYGEVEITQVKRLPAGLKTIEVRFLTDDGQEKMQKFMKKEFQNLRLSD